MVDMGSITLNTASYTNYVISFSVFLQALLYISIASFGDYGNWRKKFLIIFGILGCTSTMVMPVANEPSLYWLAGVFVILANLFQGVSYVFLDGYFPLLVRNDAAVRQGTLSFDERANRVQAIGMVSGFSTGIFFEGVTFAVLALLSQSTSTLQWMVCATGVWWLVLGIYTFMFLKERPGPPLPSGHRNYIFFSWSSVFKSISKWRKIPNTFLFLLAFFMFSDGLHTLAQFATVFCHDKLGLTNSETILVSILFPIAAALGNVALIFVQKRFQISTRMMLFSCLLVMTLVPFYALIGAFNDSFGLVHQWEAYLMAVWYVYFPSVCSTNTYIHQVRECFWSDTVVWQSAVLGNDSKRL